MINGNDIIILFNDHAIACTKSDEIQVGCEKIPISSPTTGEWTAAIAGRKSWSLTVGFLLFSCDDAMNSAMNVGQKYTIRVRPRHTNTGNDGNIELVGEALLMSYKMTATRGNLVQGGFQFDGVGELSISEA